jgi:hypothetical protein
MVERAGAEARGNAAREDNRGGARAARLGRPDECGAQAK